MYKMGTRDVVASVLDCDMIVFNNPHDKTHIPLIKNQEKQAKRAL